MEDQLVHNMTHAQVIGPPTVRPMAPEEPETWRSEMLDALFAVLPQPLCVYDDQRRLLFANPAAASLAGYPVEELVGHCEWLLLPSDTPRWRRFLRNALEGHTSHATFFRLRHRDGAWLWVHAEASTFTAGGAHLIAVTWKDCTAHVCEDPRAISAET
ncbi:MULTISPECIES: PAS domain-containing protein [unclassified Rhodococcus (in: high G+C Gram-positive bacteria)]|uniref:PAS domain-containing protein n=1 Tax=unclassified Rhodococcus (in: high G+C Gram-positive bacteria) TaxID=192944 RepID=UPI00163ABE76|nr:MULTISPECIES: PAS domain-containing protein [unclassified Rhodococcus (in: high G+C Gram-positive bacteria)]MBC2641030.1 PAS domain-containing protein [Rhodococcus sp. 3A]MBC2894225.1 PAS domain-containing protein [Rhodococcus sp. 4CII]